MLGLFGEVAGHIRMNGQVQEPQPDIHGVVLQGVHTEEATDNMGDVVLVREVLAFLPAGTDIRSVDRLTLRGITWTVEGEPIEEVSTFTGARAMIPVRLKRFGS